jgi:DNA-binding MarR family transcriptional regulator
MSPTLLSKRLSQLVRAGVVQRRGDGSDVRYVLTPAGRELQPVVEVWRGDVSWPDALRSGGLAIQGPASLRRALPRWFTLSDFAPIARPA